MNRQKKGCFVTKKFKKKFQCEIKNVTDWLSKDIFIIFKFTNC